MLTFDCKFRLIIVCFRALGNRSSIFLTSRKSIYVFVSERENHRTSSVFKYIQIDFEHKNKENVQVPIQIIHHNNYLIYLKVWYLHVLITSYWYFTIKILSNMCQKNFLNFDFCCCWTVGIMLSFNCKISV